MHAMYDTQVRSLGWEDPLEKGMASHSNILALHRRQERIPQMRSLADYIQSMELKTVTYT